MTDPSFVPFGSPLMMSSPIDVESSGWDAHTPGSIRSEYTGFSYPPKSSEKKNDKMVDVDVDVTEWLDGYTTPPEPMAVLNDLFSEEASGKASALHHCLFEGCDRSIPGYGFPRRWNRDDHMRRVHDWPQHSRSEEGQRLSQHHPAGQTPNKPARRDGELERNTLAMRTSQAGPHKCERINPSTGKPCNSVFSRPYDLTRHEDVIHNIRKQKVRCHICTEEKAFWLNDALTRHMRVVHPEVDWPGKQRRKERE